MAFAETAKLVAELELKNSLGPGVASAGRSLRGLEGSIGRISASASKGLKTAGRNIGIGAVALGGAIAFGVHQGLDSLSQLEDATTQVDGAISQLGLTGKVTSGQVAAWANEIEGSVQAAFDDKDITSATATLIRFGHLTPANIRPAMVVMTDLAAKTGDVGSASQLLAKALADPEKAAGKLAKAGVILTKEQEDQIKAMTAVGDSAGAQKVLLDALTKVTGGAAVSAVGEYGDAQNELKDTFEDVERALAVGFLPVIKEVSELLKGKLADPGFLDKVRGFGEGLADALKKALDAAQRLPWDAIGDAMKLAGAGAKAALDLFTGLPPWVQTAVLTGWGLNKLTGGALGEIVGELGKGLIKGVLGIQAAVVNINAATVNGAGGIPGAAAGGAGSLAGRLAGGAALSGALFLAADQVGRLPTYIQGLQDVAGAKNLAEWKKGFAEVTEGSTVLQAFKPALDAFKGLFPTIFGPGTPGEPMPASATQTGEQADELKRIGQIASTQLPAMTAAVKELPSTLSSFVQRWSGARDAALADGFKAGTAALKREIADKLGVTVSELKTLRGSFRTALASELGITTGELRRLNRTTGYNEEQIAAKLGISVEQLRLLKEQARITAAKTTAIAGKDFSPTIKVDTTVKSSFSVSARTVATEVQRYSWTGRKRVD